MADQSSSFPASVFPDMADLSSWTTIGWPVAVILGLWGTLIGLGKFRLADYAFALGGVVVLLRLLYDCVRDPRPKRVIVCAVYLLSIIGLEWIAWRWTSSLTVEATEQTQRLMQLDQIPSLQKQLQDMQQQQGIADAQAQQKITDIGNDNADLKRSIDKKDAILASIAKQQFALQFVPQVLIAAAGPSKLIVMNNGKTNIKIEGLYIDGVLQGDPMLASDLIVPNSAASILNSSKFITDQVIPHGVVDPISGDVRTLVPESLSIGTMDNKHYSLPFDWIFVLKDGSVSNSFVREGPIVEIK